MQRIPHAQWLANQGASIELMRPRAVVEPLVGVARDVIEDLLFRERLARQDFEITDRLFERFEAPRRFVRVGPQKLDCILGVIGGAVDHDHRAQLLAMLRRIYQHVMPAHRMPDQNRRAESPSFDNLVKVRHVVARAISPVVGPFALAMTAQIERERVEIRAECGSDKIPPVRVRGAAVNEENRALAFAAIVKAVKRESVGFETMLFHRSVAITIFITRLSNRCAAERTRDRYFAARPFHATILLVVPSRATGCYARSNSAETAVT